SHNLDNRRLRVRPDRLTRARELRKEMTRAEVILWQHLRRKQVEGFKFRRQHPIGPFVVDFFCASAKLCIELDGDAHNGRLVRDQQREVYLRSEGMTVVRLTNEDVFQNVD